MWNSLRGVVTEKTADSVFLSVSGIEWDISVPALDSAFFTVGEEARVFAWLLHRDDQMKVFGFASKERRAMFLELLKVEGIGPKAALKILGRISNEDLLLALESENLARLEAVPGLGKKTAQKMILALKGKLALGKETPDSPGNELADALIGMGYERKAALDALSRAEKEIPETVTGAEREKLLFREAIVFLSGQQ